MNVLIIEYMVISIYKEDFLNLANLREPLLAYADMTYVSTGREGRVIIIKKYYKQYLVN